MSGLLSADRTAERTTNRTTDMGDRLQTGSQHSDAKQATPFAHSGQSFFRSSVRPYRTYVHPSVRPYVRPSVCTSVRTSVRPSVLASVSPAVHTYLGTYVRQSVRPSVRQLYNVMGLRVRCAHHPRPVVWILRTLFADTHRCFTSCSLCATL